MLLDHMIPRVPVGHMVGHVPLSRAASQGYVPLSLAWSLDYSWALGWALLDLCMYLLVSVMAWALPATVSGADGIVSATAEVLFGAVLLRSCTM